MKDVESAKKGQPALAKFGLIEPLKERLTRIAYHTDYLDAGILSVLKKWLQPTQKKLPSLQIRNCLLELFKKLKVSRDAILECNILPTLQMLAKHPKETPKSKETWNRIYVKWSNINDEVETPIQKPPTDERKRKSSQKPTRKKRKIERKPTGTGTTRLQEQMKRLYQKN
eukprot:TRINITY_DN1308_c0_g1_i2.p1 TRINITY_DN1308_c0_g1~~TRINITY_DN1308_c0_g1_i2.p1  ORF type:complete len:170 (-),score=38.07 TRINITY_DN1308_c0_g1_i2:19-528(-)